MEFYATAISKCRKYRHVSIPNGMEFYQLPAHLLSFQNFVSIPNGMEFYSILSAEIEYSFGFNSQRDGILQHEFCHFSR